MASRRGYATTDDITGSTDDQITLAEQLIDAYVGFQDKAVAGNVRGEVSSYNDGTKTLFDTGAGNLLGSYDDNYFVGCELEIIGGTGSGQRGRITASSKDDHSVTLADALGTDPDTTSVYRIYQLAKFPRKKDSYHSTENLKWYREIPDAIKQATIAQTEYIISQGDEFFEGDQSDFDSERIGNYSYSRGSAGQSALIKMMAPKARVLLRGYKNSTGRIISENPTWL